MSRRRAADEAAHGAHGGIASPARRALVLAAAAVPWGAPAQTAGAPAASTAPTGAAELPVVPGRAIVLPRDLGAHPAFRTEWWYFTGWLQAPGLADPWGFQITFFRSRTDIAAGSPSRFAAQQLLFAHAAITDPVTGRLRHDQRIARAGFGIAEAAEGDTDVRLRDWRLRRDGPLGRHAYAARFASSSDGFDCDLRCAATQPVLQQGDGGYSRKGPQPAQASYYLSEPQLAVTGTLRLDGKAAAVSGRAWLDHEWSEALLHPEAVGWDWLGMNLDDGSALTAFRLRRADGSPLWSGGSWRPAGGAPQPFAHDAVRFTPLATWTSPSTGARYPVRWRIETPAGGFEVRSRLDAQELDGSGSTGSVYWEGLSDLFDGGGRRVGRGYLEMTGYAGRLQF